MIEKSGYQDPSPFSQPSTPTSYTTNTPSWLNNLPTILKERGILFLAVTVAVLGLLAAGYARTRTVPQSAFEEQSTSDVRQNADTTATESADQPDGTSALGSLIPSPSPTPSIVPSPTSAPSPTASPNPPSITISFPAEGQTVEFSTYSPTLYVVDAPIGGNTSSLKRKASINGGAWSNYTLATSMLSFNPKEGSNTFAVQYENGNGDESVVYTRNFNYHLVTYVTIGISGTVYRDENCNGTRDNAEALISTPTPVRFFSMPGYSIYAQSSVANGTFGWNGQMKDTQSLTLQVSVQSPPGYKGNPKVSNPSFTFSKNAVLAQFSVPQVPNEFVGSCFP